MMAGIRPLEWCARFWRQSLGCTVVVALTAFTHAKAVENGAPQTPEGQRWSYMALQVPLTTALYGGALPWALGASNIKTQVATPLLVAPFALGAHLWVARSFPFYQSHLLGTSYLSLASIYAGFALPASLMDDNDIRWQTGAWTSMALYPLGIFGGYALGNLHQNDPERIATQSRFAMGFGLLGFFTPLLYYEDFSAHQEATWRIGLAQSVAMAGMGHFVSRFQQTGPQVAGGVRPGILNHTLLGIASGLTVAGWADASSVRPWMGGAVLGGTMGFMEGLWFFHDNQDSRERGLYSSLGMGAGALAGAGLTLLLWDSEATGYQQRVLTSSLLAGGALLGYTASYLLTQGMQDAQAKRQSRRERVIPHGAPAWSWEFLPIPIATPEAGAEGLSWRYTVPGWIAHF
jgi:hypothetical protein